MSAISIFTCRPNSHPFQERQIPMHEPVKIGRSVARARPAPNNAIFDCKVLSRNHALIWYETGKFYLQDTKSSNGTFINNQRLSKGSEESPAREIFSGDIIQFGVDVMENSRRVTHGCIIAMVTLYHPDGREAKPSYTPNTLTGPTLGANSQEIYQLAQYLQEALHREQMLENKLATLQRLVENTQEASENCWQALIDEDRLLSRLEVLENQLQAYAKNQTEDSLRQELVALQEDKYKYENTAKESLRRVLQEKLDAVRKLSELETSLSNTEDNCTHLKSMCELAQQELERLAGTHEDTVKDVEELKLKLEVAEQNHEQELENVQQEKSELNTKLDEMMKLESDLSAQVASVEGERDSARAELDSMKENIINKGPETIDNKNGIRMESREIQVDLFVEKGEFEVKYDETETDSLKKKLKETQEQIEKYKAQIEDGETRLRDSKEKVYKLQNDLEKAQLQQSDSISQIVSLEEKLKFSDFHMSQMMENAVADLKTQLNESEKQADRSHDLVDKLQKQIEDLEDELQEYRDEEDGTDQVTLIENADDPNSNPINGLTNHVESPTTQMIPKLRHIEDLEKIKEEHCETIDKLVEATDKCIELEGLLCEARDAQKDSDLEIQKFRTELEAARHQTKTFIEEAKALQSQLEESNNLAKERIGQVGELQEQLSKTEANNREVKQQIQVLRDELMVEQSMSHKGLEDVENVKKFLDAEREAHDIDRVHLESVQQQLLEAQQAAKHSKNEAEQLRVKLKELEEEIASEKNKPDTMKEDELRMFEEPKSNEYIALREECDNLRRRIQNIEADMKRSKTENTQLSAEYSHLMESYKELEKLKDCLESKEIMWKHNLTDAQKESDNTKQEVRRTETQLDEASSEIADLRVRVNQCTEEINHLKSDLDEMSEEYVLLADRSKTLSVCSMIPILMLIFAIMLGLYPTLATVTATTAPDWDKV